MKSTKNGIMECWNNGKPTNSNRSLPIFQYSIIPLLFIFLAVQSYGQQKPLAVGPFKTVKVGNKEWTTENLDVPMPKSWYYDKDSVKNKKYGLLYFWSNAMAVVPKGWHIPSLEEWKELISLCGGDSLAGGKMMEGGESGLNLELAGHKSANITTDDLFDMKDRMGFYWTSTQKGDQTAYAIVVQKGTWLVETNY